MRIALIFILLFTFLMTAWGAQPVPSQVTGVTASQGTLNGHITLTWVAAPRAISYDIFRSSTYGTKGTIIVSNLTVLNFDNLISDTTHYFYTVVAKNATGNGPDSSQAEGWGNLLPAINTLGATQGTIINAVQLTWSPIANSTIYYIYRADTTGGTLSLIGVSTTSSYIDSTSGFGTSFHYIATANIGGVEGPQGAEAVGWGMEPVPLQVTGVNASQGTFYDKVTVSWSSSTGALTYDVYRSSSAGTKGSVIAPDQTGNSYDDGAASGGAHYFYTIIAKNGTGNSSDSSQSEGWLKVPTNITDLSATKGTLQNKVGLSWSINADATGYEIWRSTSSGGLATLVTTTGILATGYYEDTTVLGMNQYYYTVKTVIGTLKSSISNEALGYAIVAVSKVIGVTATKGTIYGYLDTNWSADPFAVSYDLYRSTVQGSRGLLFARIYKPGLAQAMPRPDSIHYFITVVANNTLGSGPDSDQMEGWAKVPSEITDLTATTGTLQNKVGLAWSVNPDATGYEIWRSTSLGGVATLITTTGILATGYFEDTTVTAMSQYYYTMKTIVGSQSGSSLTKSSFSNESMGYGLIPTSMVTGVSATQGTVYGKSTIGWTADPAATTYDVYRSTAAGTKGTIIGANVSSSSFDDVTVSGITHYYYTILAKNAASTSPDSVQAEGWGKVPSAITDLIGTKLQQAKIDLIWTKNPDATGYEIWRSINGSGVSTLIITTGALQTGYYSDTDVQDRTLYNYRIITLVDNAKSVPSNTGTGEAWLPANKVTGLDASQGSIYGQVSISWGADSATQYYDVYKSTVAGSLGSRISLNQTTTNFLDTATTGSTHYFYTVISKNPLGWGPASDQAEGWGNIPYSVDNLSATKGTVINSVQLTWSPIADATDYKIYRSASSGGPLSLIGTSTITDYNDSSAGFGVSYYYKVTALAGSVEGQVGNEASGWGKQPSPVQVTGLGASQDAYYDKVTVSWLSATNASTYDVYQSTSSGVKGSVIASDLSVLTYDDTSAIGGNHYFYTVIAKNATSSSPDSLQAVGWGKLLTTISSISATQGSLINAVDLTWSSVNDATSYNIYRATNSGGSLTLIGNSPTANFTDSTSNYGVAFYYKVSAMFGTVESPKSNEAVGWGKQPVPNQVTGIIATQDTYYEKSTVSWSFSANASLYDLYRSTASGSKGSLIASSLSILAYDDISAAGGDHYFYTVVAKNATGNSPDSAQAEGWGKLPLAANSLLATQGTMINAVQLSWLAVPDATSYKLYRSDISGGASTLLGTFLSPSNIDSTSGFGIAYYYKVTALVGSVEGPAGNEASGWGKQPAPVQVTGVSASKGIYYDKVSVSWSSSTGALTYDVYRSSSAGTKGSVIAPDQTGNSYDDGTASGGAHYFYTVVAKNGTGNSPDASQAEGWGKLPASVNTLTATQGTIVDSVQLSWTAVSDATNYNIYRATSSGGVLVFIGTSNNAGYIDNNTGSGSAYYYKVSSLVIQTEGVTGNEAAGWGKQPAPVQVTGVGASQGTFYDKVAVFWMSTAGAVAYDVYRSPSLGSRGSVISTDLTVLNYDDTVATGGNHYFYTVVAKNATGNSPDSTQAEGWGKLPASIDTLSASQGTVINAVQLSWSPVQDAVSYKIYRSTVPGGSLTLLSSSVTTDYTDSTTGSGAAFYFKVTAVVGTVEGQAGNEATGWGKQPAPPQVSGVVLSQGTYYDKVTVSWSSSTGALTYDVYRSSSAGTKGSVIAPDQTGNSYDDGTASGGSHYFYTIVAKNGTGNSPDSSQSEGWGKMPDSVNTLVASQGTLTAKVKLTWIGFPDATGYDIYRSTVSGAPGTLLSTVGTTPSYDDNNALPGSAYYYTIKTKVSSLVGPLGNEAAGWSKQPAPISSLTATLGTVTGAISLGWTSDPEASSYEVWRSDSSGGTASLIGTVTSANYLDSTVLGVSYYYYTVKTKVGAAVGPTGNEAKGFANAAPTSASVTLVTTSYVSSVETLPIVADPNIDAGQGEALLFAITEQTTTGMVSINNGKFLYIPPVDGSFSGPLSFKFAVTDRGGKTLAANGSVTVTCSAPSISTIAPTTPVLIATEFSSSLTYSIPACSKTKQIDINILDNNNVLVSSAVLSNINSGIGNVALFNTKGLSKSGTFSVKAHVSTDLGEDIKSAQLVVKPVNLPNMGVMPSTSAIDGKDTVDVTLQNPSVINCQFTKDKNTALTDSSKCFVELSTPPEGLNLDNTGAFPAFHGVIQKSGLYPIDATVSKFNGQDLLVVGKVSKTITSSCPQPTINSFSTTSNLLSYIKPSYTINYNALACNTNLSGSLVITSNKDGSVLETKPLNLTAYGSDIDYSIIGQGLLMALIRQVYLFKARKEQQIRQSLFLLNKLHCQRLQFLHMLSIKEKQKYQLE